MNHIEFSQKVLHNTQKISTGLLMFIDYLVFCMVRIIGQDPNRTFSCDFFGGPQWASRIRSQQNLENRRGGGGGGGGGRVVVWSCGRGRVAALPF